METELLRIIRDLEAKFTEFKYETLPGLLMELKQEIHGVNVSAGERIPPLEADLKARQAKLAEDAAAEAQAAEDARAKELADLKAQISALSEKLGQKQADAVIADLQKKASA